MAKISDTLQEINDFVFAQNSIVQKGKRYDEDVKFLLNTIYKERGRHAQCEEEMRIYMNPAEASKVMRLELLDNIVKLINEQYSEPFFFEKMQPFKDYIHYELIEQTTNDHSYVNEKKLLGNILKLFIEHFSKPTAC